MGTTVVCWAEVCERKKEGERRRLLWANGEGKDRDRGVVGPSVRTASSGG